MQLDTGGQFQDAILNSINEGIFTVDLNWRITAFNRAAERITGVSRQEALGRQCRDIFRSEICEKACALKQTLDTGMPVTSATARISSLSGRPVTIRISTALLKDDEGTVVGGVETFQDLTQIEELRKKLEMSYTFEDIIGRSPSMTSLFRVLPNIAESSSTVLIEGASGTGKELFARAIHNLSPRRKKPFVAINCAALPDTLLESELFGYRAGAFTDAKKDKQGRFERARGGTIFLDEIGDISPAMQVRLLRVLQERTIDPLGSLDPVRIDVRIIAATNRDLAAEVEAGSFRNDLFYRIRIIRLKLPELRERKVDIPLLVDHMVASFNTLQGRDITGVSDSVMAALMDYDYPGNVRELENIIEHAFVLCTGGLIRMRHLPVEMRRPEPLQARETSVPGTLRTMERTCIAETLDRCRGNRGKAARELGIDASTLYRKIRAYKIPTPDRDGRYRSQ